jgi:hypothetical protein
MGVIGCFVFLVDDDGGSGVVVAVGVLSGPMLRFFCSWSGRVVAGVLAVDGGLVARLNCCCENSSHGFWM